MRIPKIYKLIKLLTDKELKSIKRQLIRDKKERLAQLLTLLLRFKKKAQQPNFRAQLYQKLFATPYDKPKDYKLRNEFRLLKECIEQFLVAQYFTDRTERHPTVFNYYLLRVLQDRQALDLFQETYEKTQKNAVETFDFFFAYKNDTLNFDNYAHYRHGKAKNLAVAEALNQSELAHLSSFYLNAYRDYQVIEARPNE
ncbi:MAG: hypothetical protein AAF960_03105 [Bacteroidota bacterium]